jgi:uncharacterized Zn-finger protein
MCFLIWDSEIASILLVTIYFKLNEGINGIDFTSNIDFAKKSLAKVMNHRIEKLSSLLNAKETQLNVKNRNEISIQHEDVVNEANDDNPCSSTIKVEPLLMPESKRSIYSFSFKEHKCETCNKRFQTSTKLNIHKRIHSKHRPFACDQCQMYFSRKDNLSRHKKVHSGEKPFQCDVCQKKFAEIFHLKRHKIIHSGEKSYHCDLCDKKFARPDDLTVHKRIHTGEKPFQCGSCNVKFSHSSNLIRHKRIHTGEKPYDCDICHMKFSLLCNLIRHKRIHT